MRGQPTTVVAVGPTAFHVHIWAGNASVRPPAVRLDRPIKNTSLFHMDVFAFVRLDLTAGFALRASPPALPKRLTKRGQRGFWPRGPKTARTGAPKIAAARGRAK
jgi:hypothetical protein